MVAVRWSAREVMAEVMLCSVALLGSAARARGCAGEGESGRDCVEMEHGAVQITAANARR